MTASVGLSRHFRYLMDVRRKRRSPAVLDGLCGCVLEGLSGRETLVMEGVKHCHKRTKTIALCYADTIRMIPPDMVLDGLCPFYAASGVRGSVAP